MHESRNNADRYCYSNGVKEIKLSPPQVTIPKTSFTDSKGADCYSIETVSPPASTTLEFVFKDKTGAEVARGKRPFAEFKWTVTCEGNTFAVDESDPSCDTILPGDCSTGSCP